MNEIRINRERTYFVNKKKFKKLERYFKARIFYIKISQFFGKMKWKDWNNWLLRNVDTCPTLYVF